MLDRPRTVQKSDSGPRVSSKLFQFWQHSAGNFETDIQLTDDFHRLDVVPALAEESMKEIDIRRRGGWGGGTAFDAELDSFKSSGHVEWFGIVSQSPFSKEHGRLHVPVNA